MKKYQNLIFQTFFPLDYFLFEVLIRIRPISTQINNWWWLHNTVAWEKKLTTIRHWSSQSQAYGLDGQTTTNLSPHVLCICNICPYCIYLLHRGILMELNLVQSLECASGLKVHLLLYFFSLKYIYWTELSFNGFIIPSLLAGATSLDLWRLVLRDFPW